MMITPSNDQEGKTAADSSYTSLYEKGPLHTCFPAGAGPSTPVHQYILYLSLTHLPAKYSKQKRKEKNLVY